MPCEILLDEGDKPYGFNCGTGRKKNKQFYFAVNAENPQPSCATTTTDFRPVIHQCVTNAPTMLEKTLITVTNILGVGYTISEINIIHSSDKYYVEYITQALYMFENKTCKGMGSKYSQHFDDDAHAGVFAILGNKLVGGITYHLKNEWVYVHCGYVEEEYRGKGIYRALLKTMEDMAKSKRFHGIFASTYDFECPTLYEKTGYTKDGILHNCPNGHISINYYKKFDEAIL